MVVPDFELICEIMLVAEGFLEARLLARKFITLYQLCKELLSKQVYMSHTIAPMQLAAVSNKGFDSLSQSSFPSRLYICHCDFI